MKGCLSKSVFLSSFTEEKYTPLILLCKIFPLFIEGRKRVSLARDNRKGLKITKNDTPLISLRKMASPFIRESTTSPLARDDRKGLKITKKDTPLISLRKMASLFVKESTTSPLARDDRKGLKITKNDTPLISLRKMASLFVKESTTSPLARDDRKGLKITKNDTPLISLRKMASLFIKESTTSPLARDDRKGLKITKKDTPLISLRKMASLFIKESTTSPLARDDRKGLKITKNDTPLISLRKMASLFIKESTTSPLARDDRKGLKITKNDTPLISLRKMASLFIKESTTSPLARGARGVLKNLCVCILFTFGIYQLPAQEPAAGRVAGELAISPTGAAVYTIPLAVPPGIGEAVPSLALTYNSQGGDGIAGWGWNLAGLSTISRVGTTLHHDGVIDPVDFDLLDRFALDGQRLLLKNPNDTYGAAGTEYQTENYSNLKIVAQGGTTVNGGKAPRFFVVYYPDGSRAWYGQGNSFGALEWAISRWEDPQGNRVDYSYTTEGGVLQIDTISYGAQSKNAHMNTVTMYYKTRESLQVFYVAGKTFSRNRDLSHIEIKTNETVFRTYELKHQAGLNGVKTVESITESTATSTKPPLIFEYERGAVDVIESESSFSGLKISLPDFSEVDFNSFFQFADYQPNNDLSFRFDPLVHKIFPGDYNGDGHSDFAFKNNSKISFLMSDPDGKIASLFALGKTFTQDVDATVDNIVNTTFQTEDQRVLSRVGLTAISETQIAPQQEPKNEAKSKVIEETPSTEIQFTTYALNDRGNSILSYTKTWKNRFYHQEYTDCVSGEKVVRRIPKSYLAADFTGEGITDILMLEKPPLKQSCFSNSIVYNKTYSSRVFLALPDRFSKDEDFVHYLGYLTLKEKDQLELGDFDGDGLVDLWHFSDDKISVYKVTKDRLEILYSEKNYYLGNGLPKFLGDFNGDGKTDFITPREEKRDDWNLFLSTGKGLLWKFIQGNGIFYKKTQTEDTNGKVTLFPHPDNYKWVEHNYVFQDVNGDGFTDWITHDRDGSRAHVTLYLNHLDQKGDHAFEEAYDHGYNVTRDTKLLGLPFGSNFQFKSGLNAFHYLLGSRIYRKEFTLDQQQETLLRKVSNKGLSQSIYYTPLTKAGNVYFQNDKQKFPYININGNLQHLLVHKVVARAAHQEVQQDFKYYGAVSHARGIGFLGFMGVARTNTYGVNNPSQWSISSHSPQLRGAETASWVRKDNPFYTNYWSSISGFGPPQSGFSQKITTQYNTQTLANGVFVATVDNVKSEDALNGFTTYVSYRYDDYLNPTEILTEREGGKTQQNFSYSNGAAANSSTYHIGRVVKETETETWAGATFSTSTAYAYTHNLPHTLTTQGNGNETMIETLDYDRYGNLTRRRLSAVGLPTRTESFAYSEDGRFLKSSTDISGRTASFSYNSDGTLASETDVLGLTTSYGYDSWQRPTQLTDYLGNTHSTQYLWVDNTLITKTRTADGSQSQTWIDAWGRTRAEGRLGLDEKWHWVSSRYDAAGRVFQVSEPYTANLPEGIAPLSSGGTIQKWTTTLYDEFGRIRSQRQPNGKTLRTTYTQGQPTTTVNDGYQKITTTLDARGNIARLEDPNGTIDYTYHPSGQMATADYQSHIIAVSYDQWGRKESLSDPSVGEFTYVYDTYGQLLEENSPKGTTTYDYTPDGLVATMTQKGEHTDLSTAYDYDTKTRLPLTQTTTDGERRLSYSYGTTYDHYYRPQTRSEQNSYARFSQILTYDSYGRPQTDQRTASLSGGASKEVSIRHSYAANGMLTALKENNQSLWELKAENARGQATEVLLGNGITKKRSYDALGYLDQINDGTALSLSYSYDKRQGVLKNRTRTGVGRERFQHDRRNRLTRIQKGTEVLEQKYDDYGRLADNPKRGEYRYSANRRYAMDSLILNASGYKYYKEHPRQDALYNLDRKAVSVHEHGFGWADFAYNAQMQRTHAWYGGEEENINSRTYQKHYSSLFPAEITKNNETGKTDIVLYIGGDGYTAPAAKINNEIHYLHRDYLGSILAITNSVGTVVEERQFGAWGEVDFFKINGQESEFSDSILPRGFTGHEHFSEIALIHMNGRMYDPQLRRFLSPDNYISDPYDTRSYDRFGYVWQNPLMSIDPSGEEPVTLAVLTFVGKVLALHQAIRTVSGYASGYYSGFGPLVNAGIQIASAFIPGASVGSGLIQALPQATTGAGAFVRTVGAAAVQGFVSSSVGSVISGARLNDALKAGLQGAVRSVGEAIALTALSALTSIGAKVAANEAEKTMADTPVSKTASSGGRRAGSVEVGQGYFGFPENMEGWSSGSSSQGTVGSTSNSRIFGASIEFEMAFPRWAIGNLFGGKLGVGFEAGVLYDGNNVNFFTTTKSTSDQTYTFGVDVGGIYGIPNRGNPNFNLENFTLQDAGREMGWNFGLGGISVGGNQTNRAASKYILFRPSIGIGFDTGSTWWDTRTKIY